MELHMTQDWLLKMAEKEVNGIISVGGLASRTGQINPCDPRGDDGLKVLEREMSSLVNLIVHTARWVHPDTFRALPVWYPETARGLPHYDSKWNAVYTNTSRSTAKVSHKSELNIRAARALVAALGAQKTDNWTACHIWGVDDPKFQKPNRVVRDPKYYSCIGNMIWLPTPLKGLTDAVPGIKQMLRTCAFYLYGWVCEHPEVAQEASQVREGKLPEGYPDEWPAPTREGLQPPGVAPITSRVEAAIQKRKHDLKRKLDDTSLANFPRESVLEVLDFWKIKL